MKHVALPETLFASLLKYLDSRPHGEVRPLFDAIHQQAKTCDIKEPRPKQPAPPPP